MICKTIARLGYRRRLIRFNSYKSIDRTSPGRLFHGIPRTHPDNFLNASIFETNNDSSSIFRVQNNDNNILINYFFESILRNDFLKARVLLNKLKQRVKVKENAQNVNVYYSCLMVLLAHVISNPKSINIHNTKLIIDDVDFNFTHEYTSEIKTKLVYCLLYSYINVEIKSLKYSISKYIMTILRKWNIIPADFIHTISDAELLTTFAKVTKVPSVLKHDATKDINPIDKFKTNGLLSYSKLCEYLETRFDKYDKLDQTPLYYLYENLSPEQKDSFIREYHAFNRLKQLNIEENCLDLVEDFKLHSKSDNININKFKMSNSKLIYSWFELTMNMLNSLITKLNKPNFKSNSPDEMTLYKYRVYLNLLPRRIIVTLLISNILSKTLTSELGHARVSDLANSLGSSFKRLILRDTDLKDIKPYFMKFFHEEDSIVLFTSLISIFIHNCKIPRSFIDSDTFTQSLKLIDYSQEIDPLFLSEKNFEFPAFLWGNIRIHDGPAYKKIGVIKIHPYLLEEFKSYESLFVRRSLYLPMLCPPKPWTSPIVGGYLTDLKPVINTDDLSTSLFYINKAHKTGQLKSLYEGLNVLGSLAWAINHSTLEIFNQVMNINKGFLKIPPNFNELQVILPQKPIQSDYPSASEYNKALWKHKIESAKALQEYHAIKSQRVELNLIQQLANSLSKNGDMFYLPHNVDFRGRAYPMVSILSHYQDDLVRSLLMFWFAKPLGPDGFNWLKYQLAGVYGKDKLSMNERVEFVDMNQDLIVDSAENPLNGKMWWKSAEKPWQTLSLCFEINKVLKYCQNKANKVEDFLCRIPIHQDGSCNGLQHYAALGKDKEGGNSVNLLQTDLAHPVRSDVYTEVLNIVKSQVLKHSCDKSNQYQELATLSLLILSRKVVKQTVMTSVYGVTRHGATLQINMRIKEIIKNFEVQLNDSNDIPITLEQFSRLRDLNVEISNYLASTVLHSITKLFSGAKLIQDWLLNNCFRIINSFDLETFQSLERLNKKEVIDFFNPQLYKPMMWTSMSGFPVIQLYKHTKQKALPTSLQSIVINKPSKLANIDVRKQLNAVAPNFIHSIDSIHMLMTCLSAENNNIPFISVHDSFWTLPCDVNKLSKIIRQEFVRLHSSNIIENLRDDMMHTTRKSFQLVYVKNQDNLELIEELNKLRSQYFDEPLKLTKKHYNRLLYHELIHQTNNQDISHSPMGLIKKYNPKLYSRSKSSPKLLDIYDDTDVHDSSKNAIKLSKAFTPLLVPVKILEKPSTGDLDINKVLDSVYFFS
ncbi:unnamed protein product [Debaryomyces fabryi]|nr:unnamed protein product [Debaryomyces fabryi]